MLLITFFETTYTNAKLLNRSPKTIEQHLIAMDHFRDYLHWKYKRPTEPMLRHLTDDHMEALAGFLIREEKLAPATVNKTRRHLAAQWMLAIRKRKVKPLMPTFDEIPEPVKHPEAWTPEEVGQLVWIARELKGFVRKTKVLRAAFWPALINFLYDTGARIDVTMRLPKDSLDLDNRIVKLPASLQKQKKDQVLDISGQTRDFMAEIVEYDCPWLFPWMCDRGKGSTFTALRRNFKQKIVIPSGLECGRKTFHRLRATAATLAEDVEEGMGTKLLGHSNRQITEKSYIDQTRRRNRVRIAEQFPRPVMPPESKPSLRLFDPPTTHAS